MLCRLEWLARVVANNAKNAFVGLGPTPRDITMRELKYFTDWTKYCMKCGEKIDYESIIEELSNEST